MAAPSIPNLLSLSRGGPRRRGNARGRGGSSMEPSSSQRAQEQAAERQNQIIQSTDDDALYSRLSCIKAGYLQDPYSQAFVTVDPGRKMPIINRGTYVRTKCIDTLVENFLTSVPGNKQIVSLGAGTDTRYWRLRAKGLTKGLIYHEIDFPESSQHKLAVVRATKNLSPLDSPFSTVHKEREGHSPFMHTWGFIRSPPVMEAYQFHPLDLRMLTPGYVNTNPGLFLQHITKDLPTLLISECCLCYLEVEEARNVLGYFRQKIPDIGIVLYEPIMPNDEFGGMMTKNLAARGIRMPTVAAYPTFEAQKQRFYDAEFDFDSGFADIDFLWEEWISEEEKARVNALEGLDEVEEWQMLARHYAIIWASSDPNECFPGKDATRPFFRGWWELPSMVTDRDKKGRVEKRQESLKGYI